jgi:hypothetical protein
MSHGNKPLERFNDVCVRLNLIYRDQLDELNGYKKISYFVIYGNDLLFRKYSNIYDNQILLQKFQIL